MVQRKGEGKRILSLLGWVFFSYSGETFHFFGFLFVAFFFPVVARKHQCLHLGSPNRQFGGGGGGGGGGAGGRRRR